MFHLATNVQPGQMVCATLRLYVSNCNIFVFVRAHFFSLREVHILVVSFVVLSCDSRNADILISGVWFLVTLSRCVWFLYMMTGCVLFIDMLTGFVWFLVTLTGGVCFPLTLTSGVSSHVDWWCQYLCYDNRLCLVSRHTYWVSLVS